MARPRTPVVVLSGRLGSGKTTLLNHILRAGAGRIGVIINDFGAINVDALLVAGHVDAARSIAGGCLCCLSDTSELDRALRGLAALDLDAIVVEASGLAEPRELARLVISSTVRGVRFGGVVEVIDTAAWAEEGRYDEPPVALDHLRVASLGVVHKTDRVAPDQVDRLEELLARLAPRLPLVRAQHGQVDPELLYDRGARGRQVGQLSFAEVLAEVHDPHHAHATAIAVDDPRPVDPRRLLAWLEARPAGVYRVKGTTWIDAPGHRGRWVVQAVGGWVAFERGPWPRGQERGTRLVAVGTDLDAAAVEREVRALLDGEGERAEGDVIPLLRYLRT
ncbi:CobW family GTP-binding protein [Arsenicicoccus dermatophilus]|uniref:CobW family GTP-binding protein n=1 Tax=Arsenicicoccus dermatophilus TaxID=1076331 RepID=UPI00391762B7